MGLGTHISKPRSLTMDRWDPQWVEVFKDHEEYNKIYEYHVPTDHPKPVTDSSRKVRDAFVKAKYNMQFVLDAAAGQADPKPAILDKPTGNSKSTIERGNSFIGEAY